MWSVILSHDVSSLASVMRSWPLHHMGCLTFMSHYYATALVYRPGGMVDVLENSGPPQASCHVLAVPCISPCFQVVLGILVAAGPWPTANQSAGESRSQLWCWWSLLLFLIRPSSHISCYKWVWCDITSGEAICTRQGPGLFLSGLHVRTNSLAGRVSVYRGEAWNFLRGQSKDVMDERDLRTLWCNILLLLPDLMTLKASGSQLVVCKSKIDCLSVLRSTKTKLL